jgi:hypothetical protein
LIYFLFFYFFDSGKCEIALFADYVDDLTKKMGKSSGGLPIVVVQFAKVKIFRGNVVCCLELVRYVI